MSSRPLLTGIQVEYLRLIYRRGTYADAATALNERYGLHLAEAQIRSYAKNHGLRGFARKPAPRLLTQEQEDYLRRIWPEGSRAASVARLNERFGLALRTSQVLSYARRYGIRGAPPARYEPGHVPWQKGRKGIRMSPATEFRTGNVAANTRPLWSERLDAQSARILIKIPEPDPHTSAATRWVDKARWVWAQNYGAIPADHVVSMKDGDLTNCTPENLTLLTRDEILQLNRWVPKCDDPEVQPARIALAKLRAATGRRARV